jgi:hypothetical protein
LVFEKVAIMAKKYGEAGIGARRIAGKRRFAILAFAVVFLMTGLFFLKNTGMVTKIGVPGLVLLIFAFKAFETYADKKTEHLAKRAKDADKGARGEEKISSLLSELPDGFEVFHDVQFGGFNIDHIVASPAGIFLVETKSHGGKVSAQGDELFLNGRKPEKNFINQTWSQTYSLQNYLKEMMDIDVKITPILCFSSAFVEVRRPVKGINVVNASYLVDFLKKHNEDIPPLTLSRIRIGLKRKL